MKKYVRGKILAGQIISVAAFAYMAISSFLLAFAAVEAGYQQIGTLATLIGFLRLAEVPIAIYGIIHAIVPYGKFKKATALTSSIFNGVSAFLLIFSVFQRSGTNLQKGIDAFFMLLLFSAMALLISGMVQANKESLHSLQTPSGNLSFISSKGRFDEDFVPLSLPPQTAKVEPVVSPLISPETRKTVNDLTTLKSLFEQQLITEEEYTEKKKEILNRDFSA